MKKSVYTSTRSQTVHRLTLFALSLLTMEYCRGVMVTHKVASLMNGAYNFIIFMYQMAYGYHFSHSNAHITAISSFPPSSTACPVGVQFLPWKRGGSAFRSSTTTYCGMLLWSREHRSSLTMYIPSIDQLPRCGARGY